MATYRLLQDAWIGQRYYLAGSVATTADVGGTLPVGWTPNNNVDPLDDAAVNAFYAAGPQLLGAVCSHWTGINVAPPVTYWTARAIPGSSANAWTLTGLGAAKPAIMQ